MARKNHDETVNISLPSGIRGRTAREEDHLAATVAKSAFDAMTKESKRPRTAEFIPHVSARSTGECTVKCEADRLEPVAMLGIVKSAFSRFGNRHLAALAVAGAVVTAFAALLVLQSAARQTESPPIDRRDIGEKGANAESGEQEASLQTPISKTPERQVRLRDAVDAIANGQIDQARRIYSLLAAGRPNDRATALAAEILSRTGKRDAR